MSEDGWAPGAPGLPDQPRSSAGSAVVPEWVTILAGDWRGRNGKSTTGDSVRNSCADELEKAAARNHIRDDAQPTPVAWRYQRKEGWGNTWRLSEIDPSQHEGFFETPDSWTVKPLYASQSSPAATVETTIMEATRAQHTIPNMEGRPAQFTHNGKLEICQCRDCRTLSHSSAASDGDLREEIEHAIRSMVTVTESTDAIMEIIASQPQPVGVPADQVARSLALSYGRDPDAMTDMLEMCDAHNRPVPIWRVYEEQAEALLAAYSITRPHHSSTTNQEK